MLTSAARAADARYSLECHGIQNVNNVYAISSLLATTGATTVIGDSDSASRRGAARGGRLNDKQQKPRSSQCIKSPCSATARAVWRTAASVGGKVAEVKAKVGDSVKSGQVVLIWV